MKNKPSDAEVRSLDVLQYVLQDPLGPDATEDSIPEVVDNYFAQRAEVRRIIEEIGAGVRASQDGRKLDFHRPVLNRWNAKRFGGTTVRAVAECTGGYDHGLRARYPELPDPPYVVACEHDIHIAQLVEQVPYGVIRVIASVEGRPLSSIVRVMDYDEGAKQWVLVVSATEFFGYDVPKGDLDFHVQPARRELFAWFPADEIEDLQKGIPAERVRERTGVQTLLHDLKEWGNAT